MATAKKKINWGVVLGVIGVLVVLWLLLTHKASATGSGGGGGLVGGGGSGSGYLPQQQQQGPQSGLGLSPSFGSGSGGSASLTSALKNWIGGVLNQGYSNAALLNSSNDYLPGLGESADLSIPSEGLQLFPLSNVDIPGYDDSSDPGLVEETDLIDQSIPEDSFNWGNYDPSDFLVTQDMPSADLSDYGIDPYYGADSLGLDDTDLDDDTDGFDEDDNWNGV